jgi:hypothetical protein
MIEQPPEARVKRTGRIPAVKTCCRKSKWRRRDESGSSLILAFVFLIVTSITVLALASWVTNDLNNTSKFQNAGSLLYAAGGATQSAMWSARYTYPQYTVPSSMGYPCPGTYPSVSINGYLVADWCVALRPPGLPANVTRQITFTACLITSGQGPLTSNCSNPLLTAVVIFDDATSSGSQFNTNCTSLSTQSTCGHSMAVVRWKVQQAASS